MQKSKLPAGFLEKYSKILSKKDFQEFLKYSNKPLRKSIRVNTIKISVAEFKKIAQKKLWQLTPIPWCETGFWIDRENKDLPLGNTLEHALGLFFIQESSSMMPPEILQKGEFVLDMCSAPGSKASQLAGLMDNQGALFVNDFSATRLKKLTFNLLRCGVGNLVVMNKNGENFAQETPEFFSKILIDAPCTGEGTCRKDKDALVGWSEKKINSASILQKSLLEAGFLALKQGGELVYSTCTLGAEENENVVEFLLKKYHQAELVDLKKGFNGAEKAPAFDKKSLRIWPHIFDSEGFFVAKIIKNKSVPTKTTKKKNTKIKLKKLGNENFNLVYNYFLKDFEVDLSGLKKRLYLHNDNKSVFLVPDGFNPADFIFDRAGFVLCEIHHRQVRLHHEGAVILGNKFKGKNVYSLSREQACEFFDGKDFDLQEAEVQINVGQVLFLYQNYALGTAKIVGNKLKNLLPRNFIQKVY